MRYWDKPGEQHAWTLRWVLECCKNVSRDGGVCTIIKNKEGEQHVEGSINRLVVNCERRYSMIGW